MTPADQKSIFPITFELQHGFQEVDLTADPDARAEQLIQRLRRSIPGLSAEQQLNIVLTYQYAIERMIAEGVIYSSNFVGRSRRNPTAATTAQFAVSVRDSTVKANRPLDVAAATLRQEGRRVDLVDLSIGRCLAVVAEDTLRPPTRITGEPTSTLRRVRQIQLIVPLSDRDQLSFFALSTECLRDWDDYVQMMAEICRTIRWRGEPDTTLINSVLDGL